jgi:CBS domain-containing protein
MRISQVLDHKGSEVATTTRHASVREVVTQLSQLGIGALVVADDGVHIDGIVTERDIVRRMADIDGAVEDLPVASIMSTDVQVCRPDDDTETLMATMTDHRVRHLPVVDGERLAGIVSIGDVVKARILELEKDRKELVDYITAR